MIKLYSLILLFSISFTQNLIEDDITSFIESLDDKTLRLTIQKDNIDSYATLSILNEKINDCKDESLLNLLNSLLSVVQQFESQIEI